MHGRAVFAGLVLFGWTTAAGCVRPDSQCLEDSMSCEGNVLVGCSYRCDSNDWTCRGTLSRIDCTAQGEATGTPQTCVQVHKEYASCRDEGGPCPDGKNICRSATVMARCMNGEYYQSMVCPKGCTINEWGIGSCVQ